MQLQVGDRYSDEIGDWEVIGRPHTSKAGENGLRFDGKPL